MVNMDAVLDKRGRYLPAILRWHRRETDCLIRSCRHSFDPDFDNVRKRMSVIVRKNGLITLYCKGADNMIFDRVNEASDPLKEVTIEHLTR